MFLVFWRSLTTRLPARVGGNSSRSRCIAALAALVFPLAAAAAPPSSSPASRPWNEEVIYFVLTDRFLDGDAANNVPAESDPALYDPTQTDIDRYHGGDLRGLELALQNGYFTDLGITALWITPPVRNVWYSGNDANGPKTGYHGYWAQDFLDVDPHLVSRRSLDGQREYPDSRDGRMQHYKDFVASAHRQGIKIIQDIVCNHAGPVFYYDANGNGRFDTERKEEWTQPFKPDGHYDDARWAEIPKWDMHRTGPNAPVTVLGREVKVCGALGDLESYGRKGMNPDSLGKSNGEEIECDFFSLRDFWTAPGSARFDDLVNDFVEVYAFYVEEIGVDGFRIDTIKHVHHAFWDAFTARLRQRLGPERAKSLILFGEVYDGKPAKVGEYTYREDDGHGTEPCLDSVLDFPLCWAVRDFLRTGDKPFGGTLPLQRALRDLRPEPVGDAHRPYYNATPGLDGLNAEQKIVNFIENHDGLNRFRVQGVSERRNLLANALLLTVQGIPCLYYGTEASVEDARGKIGPDTETGRLTFLHPGEASSQPFAAARQSASFAAIRALCELRRQFPAFTSGVTEVLAATDANTGVFACVRGAGADLVIVAVNASDEERSQALKLVSAAGQPLLAHGDKLLWVPVTGFKGNEPAVASPVVEVSWKDGAPQAELRLAPETLSVFRVAH